MKKILLITILFFALAAVPAIAKQDKENQGKNKNVQAEQTDEDTEECGPEEEYKNHGDYVSCVAKTRPGGKVVSEAARSDIGKKNASGSSDLSPTIDPSLSPTGEPTPTASDAADITEVVTDARSALGQQINEIIKLLKDLLHSLLPNN